nr:NmrA family NAD(P)-binding protein [Sphingomonas tagetis]
MVIGGTGKVGTLLVTTLAANGAKVRVLVRSEDRVALLPTGVDPAVVSIVDDPDGAQAAFDGIDQVFMLNRPVATEVVEGVLAVLLARRAGVRRFVYQSVFHAEAHAHLPHVASKVAIGTAVRNSGMAWTLLSPNHFFQNDWMTREALSDGRYVVPIGGVGCSGIDAQDIAAAAARVLSSDGHDGMDYPIVGRQVLNGAACAAAWSEVLRRPVTYDTDPARWRASSPMPAWLGLDLMTMYETFGRDGYIASEREMDSTVRLLGRQPVDYADYVTRTAAQWGLS